MTALAVLRDPTLRLIAWAMLLVGALNASVYPYQSLVGIERLGLSERVFALILYLSLLGLALYFAVVWMQKKLVFWNKADRPGGVM